MLRNIGPKARTLQNTLADEGVRNDQHGKRCLKNTFYASQDAQNAILK